MKVEKILAVCDHTLLSQCATWSEIKEICDDAKKYKTASVCIPPCYVKKAKEYVGDDVVICTVIGFPNGNTTTSAKIFETKDAVDNGADEIDMVMNIGLLKSNKIDLFERDIKKVRETCHAAVLKVIIETCLLTDKEKILACQIAKEYGADFVKTSTGFSTGGATEHDIELMRKTVGDKMGVKASGGIKTYEDAIKMINAGANRLGTSSGIAIIKSAN